MSSKPLPPTILPCKVDSITFKSAAAESVPQISDAQTEANLQKAAAYLKQGRLVGFPTETVYGLGGSAMAGSDAITKIFRTKGRPADNPLIVHIASRQQLDALVDPSWKHKLPVCYTYLMDKFWPGPLTLLFPTRPGELVSNQVTCGLKTVGVRMPSHPVARALIAFADLPLAAPSANTSGKPSTTRAVHVAQDLQGKDEPACILDGGDCQVGVESTVVSALPEEESNRSPAEILRVLRLGGVSPEDLQACIDEAGLSKQVSVSFDTTDHTTIDPADALLNNGNARMTNGNDNFVPSTPGMKYKHYSPNAKVLLLRQTENEKCITLETLLSSYKDQSVGLLHLDASPLLFGFRKHIPEGVLSSMGQKGVYEEQAARIFSGLRQLDEAGVDVIFVEAVDEIALGRTVMERLRKSAGGIDGEIAIRAV